MKIFLHQKYHAKKYYKYTSLTCSGTKNLNIKPVIIPNIITTADSGNLFILNCSIPAPDINANTNTNKTIA